MNKQILLILATALAQIVNVLQGTESTAATPATPATPPKPKNGKKKKSEPEPEPEEDEEEITTEEEEEDDEITVVDEEEDEVDYDALKKEAKKLVSALVAKNPANSKKVRAILDEFEEANIGGAEDDNVLPILTALKKIK